MSKHLVAVDASTGSTRAGVFEANGRLLARNEFPIALNTPQADHAEHDSENIWATVCSAVRAAVNNAGIPLEHVIGMSFDATCSLVIRDMNGLPLSVSTGGESRWDTIVWLDHRALAEADQCTATRHRVLNYVGGIISPEMQTPKLMWLKWHLPDSWNKAGYFFDLADFLTWKASGSLARSQCTLTCKWTYLGHEANGWRREFFAQLGRPHILERGNLSDKAGPVGFSRRMGG